MNKDKLVERFYKQGLWTKKMVHNAVGKWITSTDYERIVGEKYNRA